MPNVQMFNAQLRVIAVEVSSSPHTGSWFKVPPFLFPATGYRGYPIIISAGMQGMQG
jgi:hypothetical protein